LQSVIRVDTQNAKRRAIDDHAAFPVLDLPDGPQDGPELIS
tara:strand:- start:52194 stop:52316 length:123 start_codon:yes stop_codon:yes gene_type:complete